MFDYRCKIIKVVDGDTVDVDIDLGFGVWLRDERVRLAGIDAPESRTSDPDEKIFGIAAKERLQELLPVGSCCILQSKDYKGKFGRILGDFKVIYDASIVEILIREHHGVPYHGQSKAEINAAHLENRRILVESGVIKHD